MIKLRRRVAALSFFGSRTGSCDDDSETAEIGPLKVAVAPLRRRGWRWILYLEDPGTLGVCSLIFHEIGVGSDSVAFTTFRPRSRAWSASGTGWTGSSRELVPATRSCAPELAAEQRSRILPLYYKK